MFADLGVPRPNEALAKAHLARAISLIIEREGTTQQVIAERLGIDQPKVSALLRGRLTEFSTDRLLRFLILLGHDVNIQVSSHRVTGSHANLHVALV